MTPEPEALQVLRNAGLIVDIIAWNAGIQRVPTADKPRKKNGAYVAYSDPPASLWWMDWATGEECTWTAKNGSPLTAREREIFRKRTEETKRQRDAEQARIHVEAAQLARDIYSGAPECDNHPYLDRKGVATVAGLKITTKELEIPRHDKPEPQRIPTGSLIIPAYNEQREISTLQFIPAEKDSHKTYMAGGKKSGAYFPIAPKPIGAKKPLLICEGLATGLSLHECTGQAVLVAFDAGNLEHVARYMRRQFPNLAIILTADNDCETDGNPGITKATEAAKAIGASVAIPYMDGQAVDFNDLHKAKGSDEVMTQILRAVTPISPEQIADKPLFVVRSATEYITGTDIKEPEPLISGVLPVGTVGLIYGVEKTGKTSLALQLAYCLASGADFLGFEIPQKHTVLMLSPEGGDASLKQRIRDSYLLVRELNDNELETRLFFSSTEGRAKIDNPEHEKYIRDAAAECKADVVILDSIYRFQSRGNSNSHDDMRDMQDALDRLKASGLTVIVVHHARKPSKDGDMGTAEIRGAGWGQYADAIMKLSKNNHGFSLEFTLRHYAEPGKIELLKIEGGPLFRLKEQSEQNIPLVEVRDILEANGGRIEGKASFVKLIQEENPDISERGAKKAIDAAERTGLIQSCKLTGARGGTLVYFIPNEAA